jgi:hypothetical protein
MHWINHEASDLLAFATLSAVILALMFVVP